MQDIHLSVCMINVYGLKMFLTLISDFEFHSKLPKANMSIPSKISSLSANKISDIKIAERRLDSNIESKL